MALWGTRVYANTVALAIGKRRSLTASRHRRSGEQRKSGAPPARRRRVS